MFCPYCSSYVPNGTTICPACHADLTKKPQEIDLGKDYCPSCGALVPKHALSCPKCGMQLPDKEPSVTFSDARPQSPSLSSLPSQPAHEKIQQVPDFLEKPASQPQPIPEAETGFESAVPVARDPFEEEVGWHGVSSKKIIVTASIAAVIFIVFIALFIMRPWDNKERGSEGADISRAGEIETVQRLTGQDSDRSSSNAPQSEVSQKDATTISQVYQGLGELHVSISNRIESVEKDIEKSESERAAVYSEVMGYETKIEELSSKLSSIDPTGNTVLSNDVLNLKELVEVLEKELYGLTETWTLIDGYMAPDQVRSIVMQPLLDQRNAETEKDKYAEEFEKKYMSFSPASPNMVA